VRGTFHVVPQIRDAPVTPGARVAAAIAVLDEIAGGRAAEQALTNWARGSRYAGSGDRAAVRDLVYDAIRRRRSYAALAGVREDASGRVLMLGALVAAGQDAGAVFTGVGHAPDPVTADERNRVAAPDAVLPEAVALDCPDWLAGALKAGLGQDFAQVMQAMRSRAPVFLRANTAKLTRDEATAALRDDKISCTPHPLADTALLVMDGANRIKHTPAYLDGQVEVQDAASQAATALIPVKAGDRVLDFCAGGGGKTLALAARVRARFFVHDIDPQRMRDITPRAARAGVVVTPVTREGIARIGPFECVVIDAPCSGSGTWARAPHAKWTLTPARLADLCAIQAAILDETAAMVRPGGVLAYLTCSLLDAENGAQVSAFLARQDGWTCDATRVLTPLEGGDGFFAAILRAPANT
jgi:16S rRNA (cytosine967-C5)-methyltransferase